MNSLSRYCSSPLLIDITLNPKRKLTLLSPLSFHVSYYFTMQHSLHTFHLLFLRAGFFISELSFDFGFLPLPLLLPPSAVLRFVPRPVQFPRTVSLSLAVDFSAAYSSFTTLHFSSQTPSYFSAFPSPACPVSSLKLFGSAPPEPSESSTSA